MTKLRIIDFKHSFPDGTRFLVDGDMVEDEYLSIGKGQIVTAILPSNAWYLYERGEELAHELTEIIQYPQDDFLTSFESANRRAGQAIISLMALLEAQCGKRAWRNDGLEAKYPHLFRQLEVFQEIRNLAAHGDMDLDRAAQDFPKSVRIICSFLNDCETGAILRDGPRSPPDPTLQAKLGPLFSLKGSVLNMLNNGVVWHVSEVCLDYLIFKRIVIPAERN